MYQEKALDDRYQNNDTIKRLILPIFTHEGEITGMEGKRTLWMFEFLEGDVGKLIPFYATDASDAAQQALAWAEEHGVEVHGEPKLTHYPRGFVIMRSSLPGTIDEERPEVQ